MGSRGKIDVKGAVECRIDSYATTREIISGVGVKEKSEGKFGGMGAMLEGEVVHNGIGKGIIKPYVGARFGIVNTKGFKEEGASLGLEVKDSNYVRGSIRTGIKTEVEKEKVKYTIGVGIECIVVGREKELESTFVGLKDTFKIKSVKEGIIRGEVELGLDYEVSERTGVYAKVTGGVGSYSNIGGNVGLKYAFGR
jgi:outer membrane autotransporter protein